jgi:hypothetical protein
VSAFENLWQCRDDRSADDPVLTALQAGAATMELGKHCYAFARRTLSYGSTEVSLTEIVRPPTGNDAATLEGKPQEAQGFSRRLVVHGLTFGEEPSRGDRDHPNEAELRRRTRNLFLDAQVEILGGGL